MWHFHITWIGSSKGKEIPDRSLKSRSRRSIPDKGNSEPKGRDARARTATEILLPGMIEYTQEGHEDGKTALTIKDIKGWKEIRT